MTGMLYLWQGKGIVIIKRKGANKMSKKRLLAIISTIAMIGLSISASVPSYAVNQTRESTCYIIDPSEGEEIFWTDYELFPAEECDFIIDADEGHEIFEEGDAGIQAKNADISQQITLKKGGSKTFSFTVNGGEVNPNHNSVSVVITTASGNDYRYIFENVTDSRTIANTTRTGNFSGSVTNMDPNDNYEITIINLEASAITLQVSITTYIS